MSEVTSYLYKVAETMKDVRKIHQQQDIRKSYADSKRKPATPFCEGDLVLVKTHALSNAARGVTSKFVPKRDGSYKILKKKSDVSCEVTNVNGEPAIGCYHVSDLTPYVTKEAEDVPAPTVPIRRWGSGQT